MFIIVFLFLTVKQLIFNNEIHWIDNIGLSLSVFLAYIFVEWARKPHEYKKDKDNNS